MFGGGITSAESHLSTARDLFKTVQPPLTFNHHQARIPSHTTFSRIPSGRGAHVSARHHTRPQDSLVFRVHD